MRTLNEGTFTKIEKEIKDFYISDYYYDGNEKIYADSDLNIKVGKRINIDYSEEAKDYPWRFYL